MGLIPDQKIVALCEGVARIEKGFEDYDRRLERVEHLVDKSSGSIVKIEKKLLGHSETGLDTRTLIKYGVILLGMLIAGGAGGHGLMELIKIALTM